MKNLFVVKNIEFAKKSAWSSIYDLDKGAAEKEIEKLPLKEAVACRQKISEMETPIYKDFHFAYQYCLFTKRDCGHIEILQTHYLDGTENYHKGICTKCMCDIGNK